MPTSVDLRRKKRQRPYAGPVESTSIHYVVVPVADETALWGGIHLERAFEQAEELAEGLGERVRVCKIEVVNYSSGQQAFRVQWEQDVLPGGCLPRALPTPRRRLSALAERSFAVTNRGLSRPLAAS